MSHIAILAGQYHLSARKIRSLLQEQFGTTFSVGAISEAQSRIASMLTPLHQAIKTIYSLRPWYMQMKHHTREMMRRVYVGAGQSQVMTQSMKKSFTLALRIQKKQYWARTIVASWSVTNIAATTGFLRTNINYVGRMSFAIYNKLPITQVKATQAKQVSALCC